MKRLLVNGSPRGRESNSRLLLSWIAEGMASAGVAGEIETIDLARANDLQAQREAFLAADEVVTVMPLYTDSMPALVKRFIDSFADAPRARLSGKRVAFVVQSGFPESKQGGTLAAYLARLSARCGWTHLGTVVKGGIEGIRIMPPLMTNKTRDLFRSVGASVVRDGRVDPAVIRAAARPYTLSPLARFFFRLLAPTGLTNMYWHMNMKKHGAYERRFDAPYGAPFKG